jgi:tripartite-type tricarboxylate transporter receptor subunit TctC
MHHNERSRGMRRKVAARTVAVVFGAAMAAAYPYAAVAAAAGGYPDKPIRLVVPFGAGGAVDVVARVLAKELAGHLGQNVIVENRTGAGGNIAAAFVAKADPDGYTLLMGSTGNSVNGSLYRNLTYDPDRDLEPVALVGTVPTVLLANPSVPASNVHELIALAKARPGSLNFASGGSGTTEHLAAVMFNTQAGTAIHHVPYRGGNPALTDLIAGQVQLMFTNQLNALPYLKSGQLKALGMASEHRSKELPNVPTLVEQGMAGFTASVWWGVFGPAHMPGPVVAKLNQSINAAVRSADMQKQLENLGATPLTGTPQQFAAFYATEAARWRKVIETAHIKVD